MDNNTKRLLPANYHGKKYGLTFRLVNVEDAEFIAQVRNSPHVGAFLHKTSANVDVQKEWIRQYKKREEDGLDYYFIYFKKEKPIGLNRLYSFHDTTYTGGSWVMMPDTPVEAILATSLIQREIAFEELGMLLEDSYDGVHIDNKKVLKYNKMFGCKEGKHVFNDLGEFIRLTLTKEDFLANKQRLIKMLNLDNNNE